MAVQVDAAACGVVSQAGGVALLEIARVSVLDRLLSAKLEPWRAPRAGLDSRRTSQLMIQVGGDSAAEVAARVADQHYVDVRI